MAECKRHRGGCACREAASADAARQLEEARAEIAELKSQLRAGGLTEVWVAASGTDYECGGPEDAFATEAAALAWLRARREEVIEKQVRWIDDPEEAARFRESFPEIVSEDGAHRLRNLDEWWSVVRHPLADLVPNGHEAAR